MPSYYSDDIIFLSIILNARKSSRQDLLFSSNINQTPIWYVDFNLKNPQYKIWSKHILIMPSFPTWGQIQRRTQSWRSQ